MILIRDILIPLKTTSEVNYDNIALSAAKRRFENSSLFPSEVTYRIYKKSVDARNKNQIYFLYTISAEPTEPFILSNENEEKAKKCGFGFAERPAFTLPHGTETFTSRPVVAGFGPAGMFAALALALSGFRPIVLERGKNVEERTLAVERYWSEGILDENTNVQFGEGGAGTFSDGKLLTRISDNLCNFVLETLVENGANPEILYQAKPHIGTDCLRSIVKNIREKIKSLGGEIFFESALTDIVTSSDGSVCGVEINRIDTIPCGALFLALGHSARDSFYMLEKKEIILIPKPFSVGVRIEHLQADIDRALYGSFAGLRDLGHAEYTLSRRYGERGVYSFCMCPGGTVVASATERDEIVTNGMSYALRDGKNANAAIAVSVLPKDFSSGIHGAINYQKQIEQNAFLLGKGGAPIQTVGDFVAGTMGSEPGRIIPTYTGKTTLCEIGSLFPKVITDHLKHGIKAFESNIGGFSINDAVLTAPETRTSSPVRIVRTSAFTAEGHDKLYPCGEGAGYAGGITSAAVDGLRAALAFLERYRCTPTQP